MNCEGVFWFKITLYKKLNLFQCGKIKKFEKKKKQCFRKI